MLPCRQRPATVDPGQRSAHFLRPMSADPHQTPSPVPPPPFQHVQLAAGGMRLDSGRVFGPFTVAYQTYGTLDADRANAILVCHALTGDQFVAETHPVTGKPGWWERMVGPGRPVDTDRFFVICANVLGGCMGTTGPRDIDPARGLPYGLDFPVITIGDMVRAQALLLDHLGIEKLFAVVGGSMGGMQALQWAASYPDRVFACMAIATAAKHSAQNIAFHEVGRQAILADPDWMGGDYAFHGCHPKRGLSVARMAAHITYLSEAALQRKFGRSLQDRDVLSFGFDADFQVESYLRHQGSSFVDRFDANSYLYITRAMDYFDLAAERGGQLADAFRGAKTRFLLVSFSSDWLFPTPESRTIAHALNAVSADVSFVEVETDKGHDAFLLDEPAFLDLCRGFLDGSAQQRGLKPHPAAPAPVRATGKLMRADLRLIAGLIEPGARLLDVGAGDGSLLEYLVHAKQVDGRGLEIDPDGVRLGVAQGLTVIQGDANTDLTDYPADAFDWVVLSRTLQTTRDPADVLEQLVRIGRRAIVAFENYGHWRARLGLLVRGRAPGRAGRWWENPNIHPCTIADFLELCESRDITIERAITVGPLGLVRDRKLPGAHANMLAEQAVFVLRGGKR
jgi:homoserine O-acetyltransferase/O-succinyltransferase